MSDVSVARENLVFYVLMRSDLASMNNGKASAQAAHAQKHADVDIKERAIFGDEVKERYLRWEQQTPQGFGTTICLEVDERQMRGAVDLLRRAQVAAGVVHDPTYPLVDGKVVHQIPLDTCGWAFGSSEELRPLLSQFGLHP